LYTDLIISVNENNDMETDPGISSHLHSWKIPYLFNKEENAYKVATFYVLSTLPNGTTLLLDTPNPHINRWWVSMQTPSRPNYRQEYCESDIMGMDSIIQNIIVQKKIKTPEEEIQPSTTAPMSWVQLPVTTDGEGEVASDTATSGLPWQLEEFPGAPAYFFRYQDQPLLMDIKKIVNDSTHEAHAHALRKGGYGNKPSGAMRDGYSTVQWLAEVPLTERQWRALKRNRSRQQQRLMARVHSGTANSSYLRHVMTPCKSSPVGKAIYAERHHCHQCNLVVSELPALHFILCESQRRARWTLYQSIGEVILSGQKRKAKNKDKIPFQQFINKLWLNIDGPYIHQSIPLQAQSRSAQYGLLLAVALVDINASLQEFKVNITSTMYEEVVDLVTDYWVLASKQSEAAFDQYMDTAYPDEELGSKKRKRIPTNEEEADQLDVDEWDELTADQQLNICAIDEGLEAFRMANHNPNSGDNSVAEEPVRLEEVTSTQDNGNVEA